MNVLILGSDRVASTLADRLDHEHNQITMIDTNFNELESIRQKIDIRVIHGLPSSPEVIKKSGIENMDIVLAVSPNDEINILACKIAHILTQNPKLVKIARIHSNDYLKNANLLTKFKINQIINPESLVSEYIENIIKNPGVSQLIKFINSPIQLFAIKVEAGSAIEGKLTKDLHNLVTGSPAYISIIFRDDEYLLPKSDTVIKAGDELYLITPNSVNTGDYAKVMLNQLDTYQNIVIAGGGHIGFHLAQSLEHSHNVFLIEKSQARCDQIIDQFSGSTVLLRGSAEDHNILEEANIRHCDLFFAASNFDEINILSCVVAKNMGARHTTCLVNNHHLVPVVEKNIQIDLALSPDRVTVGNVLKYLRKNQAIAVHPLRKGYSEVIEIEVNEQNNYFSIDKKVKDVVLPKPVSLAAIIRKSEMLKPDADLVIERDDHLILIIADSEVMKVLDQILRKHMS